MLGGTKRPGHMRLLILLIPFLLLTACGYTIIDQKGIFQGEVVSLDVPVFKNRSLEPQVSEFFTEAFTRELVTTGLFDVNRPDAPNTLQGSITAVTIVPTTLDKNGLVVEKMIYVTLGFALSKKDGRVIKSWGLGDAEPYRVDDINLEDPNKKEAMKRIAARIARRFSALVIADIDRKAL
jgi:outer membrane lipopolysaccharide assembly protein LptE/RlpB